MMTAHTKRILDSAIDELKRNGYACLLILFDKKSDESRPLGDALEVLFSESNDPKIVSGMCAGVLAELARKPQEQKEMVN